MPQELNDKQGLAKQAIYSKEDSPIVSFYQNAPQNDTASKIGKSSCSTMFLVALFQIQAAGQAPQIKCDSHIATKNL